MGNNTMNVAGTLDIFNIPANFFISESREYYLKVDGEFEILESDSFEERMVILSLVRAGGEVVYSFKSDNQKMLDYIKNLNRIENKVVEFLNV